VDFAPQAQAISKYVADLEKLLKDKQGEFTERNLELQEVCSRRLSIRSAAPASGREAYRRSSISRHEKCRHAVDEERGTYSAALPR